jgi:hypothetical protein
MYFSDSDIKQDILDNLTQLNDSAYPEDIISELADSATPVYYNQILADWQEMPSEFNDSWQELGTDGSAGILTLMQIDLFNYYHDSYRRIFSEVLHDMEQEESEANA